MNHWPVWAKLIAGLGFPIAVALFFLLMFAGYIPSPLAAIEGELRSHVKSSARMLSIQRQICRNTARSEYQQTRCDDP